MEVGRFIALPNNRFEIMQSLKAFLAPSRQNASTDTSSLTILPPELRLHNGLKVSTTAKEFIPPLAMSLLFNSRIIIGVH
jgi:hypothetical protein